MSKLSDQLMGSNPTEPMSPSVLEGLRRKGTDLDISALRAVDACSCMIHSCVCLRTRKKNEVSKRRDN